MLSPMGARWQACAPGRGPSTAAAPMAAPAERAPSTKRGVRAAALGDFFKSFFDYDSWAPKSSRIWRLQQYQVPEADSLRRGASGADADEAVSPESMRVLEERLEQLRSENGGAASSSSGQDRMGGDPKVSAAMGRSSSSGALSEAQSEEQSEAARSFSDADDDELTFALNRRISEIATATGSWGASVEEEDMRQPLTGEEIQRLLMSKYGKLYDISFAKRSIPGKTFVSLNLMWLHMGQRSFKLSPQQYAEKLDGVAALVNALNQTDKVRAFLSAPARPQNGMPPRPVVGTAVSIRLDLTEAQVAEWFGSGFD